MPPSPSRQATALARTKALHPVSGCIEPFFFGRAGRRKPGPVLQHPKLQLSSEPSGTTPYGGRTLASGLARSLGIVRDLDQVLLLATSPSVLTTAAQLLVLRCPRVEASPSLDFPSGTSDAVFRAIENTVSLFTSSDYLSRNCKSITVIHRPGPHFAGSGSPSPERSRAMPRSSTRMGWRRRCPASSALSERITEL